MRPDPMNLAKGLNKLEICFIVDSNQKLDEWPDDEVANSVIRQSGISLMF